MRLQVAEDATKFVEFPPHHRGRNMPRHTATHDFGALSIARAADLLMSGAIRSTDLVMQAVERASDPSGEGSRVFTRLYDERARREAESWDATRGKQTIPSALAGLPISVKDLFDVAGEVTTAGSRALAHRPAAEQDAEVVARLRRAGAIIVGKTNMTEFAFSGLGLNPHFGTPRNPFERALGRIPGGSSSGAAISVTDGMAIAAVGTDTGGSVRIPAAVCGLIGFKPTAKRVPRDGSVPLSRTLDSVGPIARTVECCAVLDAVMAGIPVDVPAPADVRGLKFAVARTLVWDDAERQVASCVEQALTRLSLAGAALVDRALPELAEIPKLNAKGGFSGPEAFAWHRKLIAERRSSYDPRVLTRIEAGAAVSAADYLDLIDARTRIQGSFAESLGDVDAWICPTVPRTAMEIASLATDDAYAAANRLILRNPSLVNFLDGCAISLPCHVEGSAPVGISFAARHGDDRRLLAIARAVVSIVAGRRPN
jgi:aspartyl-tRNA(Asn)/glutamyl-tRNA(Gln) amidotransferase subunit A